MRIDGLSVVRYRDCPDLNRKEMDAMPKKMRVSALSNETRPAIPTDEAARLLGRRPQTLRKWACYGDGPICPIRVHGKLLWPVSEIRRLLRFIDDAERQAERQTENPSGAP